MAELQGWEGEQALSSDGSEMRKTVEHILFALGLIMNHTLQGDKMKQVKSLQGNVPYRSGHLQGPSSEPIWLLLQQGIKRKTLQQFVMPVLLFILFLRHP